MQNRRVATWLTEAEYESFESDWESQQQIREELRGKSDELRRYENKHIKPLLMTTKQSVLARESIKINRLSFAI